VGPGEKLVLLTPRRDALFVWRKFIDDSGQQGVNCAVFRNEGPTLSSHLITEAMGIAWRRWPGARLYTYVDAGKIRSSHPGYCFRMAGWTRAGTSKGGLVVLEAPNREDVIEIEPRPGCQAVYGSQDLDAREQIVIDFSNGRIPELAAKPVMLGAGCNLQRHCHWAIFLGIGFKFADFIQAIHRLRRFGQQHQVRVDLIYTEAEREIRADLIRKWTQHDQMVQRMTELIREFGLSQMAMMNSLTRALGVERVEVSGDGYRLVNNDCVLEAQRMADASVDLILTSIPFSTQYEYSPNYADFGHSDHNAHFFEQMDFLTPHLLRVLKPGRLAVIHVKDRIVPMGMTGLGSPTVYPFHSDCIQHYRRHGFAYMGMKTIATDVVRENNQTYRLGWTEQCKDATKMGVGMPEYLLLFRKPPTDTANSYADEPVVKDKAKYSRSRWQVDAHGFTRSSGNRLLTPEELEGLPHDVIFKLFRDYSLSNVYDFEHHVRLGEALEAAQRLPVTFMLLQPQSWHPDIWTDITRMLTLNGAQSAAGREMHLCPMQFDLADRAIAQWSQPGEVVFDPFAGLGTVPYRAVMAGRRGLGVELSHRYFLDAATYCAAAARQVAMPDLFSTLETDSEAAA
jgi:DNA modification methylase